MGTADPFALPPPSTARLRLLFLTVAAGSFFAGHWFLVLAGDAWRDQALACGRLADVPAFLDCSTRVMIVRSLAPWSGPLLVAAPMVLAYALAPLVITRRHRAAPLADWPEVVEATVRAAGLARRPVLMQGARDLLRDRMFVYGRHPRHRVMLSASAGFSLSGKQAKPAAVAMLAHELGHLRNRDADRSYLAVFATVCYVLVAAVPLCLSAALTMDGTPARAVAWRTAVVTLLVAGTFAAVVRAREHDADLRAARSHPDEVRAWLSSGRQERPWPVPIHPSLASRLRVLNDPAPHMRASPGEALTAGVAAGIVVTELGVPLQTALPIPPIVAYWIAGLLVAVPVVQVVGLGVWRAVLAEPARPAVRPRVAATGLALGAGFAAGAVLSPRASAAWNLWLTTAPEAASNLTPDRIPLGTTVWLLAAVLLPATAITCWLALAARAWLPARGPSAWRYAAPVAVAVIAVVSGTWFVAVRLAAGAEAPAGRLAWLVITPQVAVVLAVLVLLCALALRPLRGRRSRPVVVMVPAVLLVTALAGMASLPEPAAREAAPPPAAALPDAVQAGAICLGLFTTGTAAFGDPADHPARARMGELLRGSDDALLRQVGSLFLDSADRRSTDLAAVAWTAFVWRCDQIRRYPAGPVPQPTPPFPVESW
ncbi:M48 family metalloprotease [Microbispora sp. NPDC004025]